MMTSTVVDSLPVRRFCRQSEQRQFSDLALYLPNHRGSKRINAFIDFLTELLKSQTQPMT